MFLLEYIYIVNGAAGFILVYVQWFMYLAKFESKNWHPLSKDILVTDIIKCHFFLFKWWFLHRLTNTHFLLLCVFAKLVFYSILTLDNIVGVCLALPVALSGSFYLVPHLFTYLSAIWIPYLIWVHFRFMVYFFIIILSFPIKVWDWLTFWLSVPHRLHVVQI